jgi:hypothetical protein
MLNSFTDINQIWNNFSWHRYITLPVTLDLSSSRYFKNIFSIRQTFRSSEQLGNRQRCWKPSKQTGKFPQHGDHKKKVIAKNMTRWTDYALGANKSRQVLFSLDVTAAMLVSQTNSVGVELFSYENTFFCSNKFAWLLATWVKTLYTLDIRTAPVSREMMGMHLKKFSLVV